jgi:hypothetical protein
MSLKRWWRWAGALLFAPLLLGALLEGALRWLGYGDPPLFVLDPHIEYYARQGTYQRFGRTIAVTEPGIRRMAPHAKGALRVALLGDSIVFGTNRLEQRELISYHLEQALEEALGRRAVVLPLAATSWGPVNQSAYLERFGWFGAERVLWVLSAHDLMDVPAPGYAELLPQEPPVLALQDAWWSLRLRAFSEPAPTEEAARSSLQAIDEVLGRLRRAGVALQVFLHPSRGELASGPSPPLLRLQAHLEQRHVAVESLAPALTEALARGEAPYEDELHLAPAGTRAVARWLALRLSRDQLAPTPTPAP